MRRLRLSTVLVLSSRGLRGGPPQRFAPPTPDTKALDVAVIGAPNVGKSLLTNQLVRAAVSAVSSKMDTTTKNVCAAITEGDIQLVVVDSPGTIGITHARKVMGISKGNEKIVADPEEALHRAEHVIVVQDATAPGDYIHHRVLHLLHRHSHLPASLVINKVDLVTDRTELLELTRILTKGRVAGKEIKTAQTTIGRLGRAADTISLHSDDMKGKGEEWQNKYRSIVDTPSARVPYSETRRLFADERGWGAFDAVFYASALSGEGVEPLREHLKSLSTARRWRLDENAVTTKTPQSICEESVRAALLDTVPTDIAYRLKPRVREWLEDGELLQIVVDINCDKERIARNLTGKGGAKVTEVSRRVNDHMATLFQRQLFVQIQHSRSAMAVGNRTALQAMATTVFDWAASTSIAELTGRHMEQLTDLCDLQSNRTNNSTGLLSTSLKSTKPTYFDICVVGLAFVTVINMCALLGIGVMRYLSKSVYNQVITFMVGLGVGSLSGSSLYHLLPQAHPQLLEQVDKDGNPTHAYLVMAHFSLIGVYTFFLADKLIKIILQWRKKGSRTDRKDEKKQIGELIGRRDVALLHEHLNHEGNGDGCANEIELSAVEDLSCKSMGDQAHGMCSHEHQIEFGAGDSAMAAVAWMILFGDGLHNLIDGISIGASFADNTLSGLSVSLAVLAEEFPHELGDVAILVASGLSLKQALVYNLLSALTCYIGFFIGVYVGDLDTENTKYLFALAGGMFLYIALSCMMPEMKKAMEEALNVSIRRGLYVFFLQSAGLFSGLFLMFAMARWGSNIEEFIHPKD